MALAERNIRVARDVLPGAVEVEGLGEVAASALRAQDFETDGLGVVRWLALAEHGVTAFRAEDGNNVH